MRRRKLITLLAALTLFAPLMFYGCSGDDGATGPQGPPGPPGGSGGPGGPGTGVVAEETCVICHGAGTAENVTDVHRLGQTAGSMTVTIQSIAFGSPVDNNVPVTVNFTFAATNSAGDDITKNIDLRTATNTDNLAYIRFSLAQLKPGQNGSPDEWAGFVVTPGASGSGPFSTANRDGINGASFVYDNVQGTGTYKFRTNAIRTTDGYVDNAVTRAFIQVSGVPVTLFTSDPYFNTSLRRPVANAVKDVVSGVGVQSAAPGAGYPVKTDVSTNACNNCHDPLGIHGGGRREYKACQVCHNAKLETVAGGAFDNGNLVNLIHKIHNSADGTRFTGVQDIGELDENNNFTKILFPQAINNCTTCHQGPTAADNTYDNFKNRPSALACGACHFKVNFATGAGHAGGAKTDATCTGCHQPDGTGGIAFSVTQAHAAKEGAPTTPNNPTLAAGLRDVRYGILSATVDNTNAAIIKFNIKIDNVVANLGDNVIKAPTGFSGSPAFLLAYTLPQDNVSAPADYNNRGRTDNTGNTTGYAGQPQSVNIVGLPITAKDNTWTTVKVANAFPPGAKMRAVGLQAYFTQTNAIGTDNIARHTPAVMVGVTGDTARRTVVKSGYNATTGKPEGCLECHEVFEGHGGNRVNNVQVCVMCHNPNLTSSGRTIVIDNNTNSDITTKFGTDPLKYPEVTNNFKELIHGIHANEMRATEFVDIRNRANGVLILGEEILYPGDLSHCTKCHVGTTYQNVQVPNSLFTTEKITTGVAGETRAQIIGARNTVPNPTDLVNSPTASACGYCHDTSADLSHFQLMGGDIKVKRSDAVIKSTTTLMPVVDITP